MKSSNFIVFSTYTPRKFRQGSKNIRTSCKYTVGISKNHIGQPHHTNTSEDIKITHLRPLTGMQHTTSIRSKNWSKGAPVAIYLLLQYMFPCEKAWSCTIFTPQRLCMSEIFTWEHVLKEIVLTPQHGADHLFELPTAPNAIQFVCVRGDLWRYAVGMIFCHFYSITPFLTIHVQISNFGRQERPGGNEGSLVILFFCYFYSRQCAHLSSNFLPSTERRCLDRRWVTVSENACICIYFVCSHAHYRSA